MPQPIMKATIAIALAMVVPTCMPLGWSQSIMGIGSSQDAWAVRTGSLVTQSSALDSVDGPPGGIDAGDMFGGGTGAYLPE